MSPVSLTGQVPGDEHPAMTSITSADARPVLADLVPIPRALVRDTALVVGAALLTALCAQIEIMLPFSPVPISGQTFAVLLTAAALGPLRGVLGQGLYVLLGAVGLPFYSGGDSGWTHLVGATGGYLVGFVVAAALVGWCARRGLDRTPQGTLLAFTLGNVVIFGLGVPWLAVVADLSLRDAVVQGVLPFIPGGIVKSLLAAGLLPVTWRLTRR
jgi:biotin transport system substrate-specific component